MKNLFKILMLLAFAGSLAACKSELYSSLQEREANEMIAALATANISATREGTKDGAYSVLVEGSAIPDATRILSANGLPRAKFETLGKVFQSGSMVSTPFEERARFMYAMDQELAQSISQISGVASARVHVIMPEQAPLETKKEHPRASVFIYLNPGVDIRGEVGTIKTLIVNSVNGLAYEDVAVALFPAAVEPDAVRSSTAIASIVPNGFGIVLALMGLAIAVTIMTRQKRASKVRRLS